MLKFFTVEYQVDRCISFLDRAVKRLNILLEEAASRISKAEASIAEKKAEVEHHKFQQERITRIKTKLEGLLS